MLAKTLLKVSSYYELQEVSLILTERIVDRRSEAGSQSGVEDEGKFLLSAY